MFFVTYNSSHLISCHPVVCFIFIPIKKPNWNILLWRISTWAQINILHTTSYNIQVHDLSPGFTNRTFSTWVTCHFTRSNVRQQSLASSSVKSQHSNYTSYSYYKQAFFSVLRGLIFKLFVNKITKKDKKEGSNEALVCELLGERFTIG